MDTEDWCGLVVRTHAALPFGVVVGVFTVAPVIRVDRGQGCVRTWRSARQSRHRRWSTDSRTGCDELPLAHARYGTVVYLSVSVALVEHIIDVLPAHLAHSGPEEGLEIRDDTLRRSGGPPPRLGRLARDVHYGQRRGENRRSTRSRQNGN
jgi:hypothetical protein